MLKAINENKVSFLLLLTVVMGLSHSHINWPDAKVDWWENTPHSFYWFTWFVNHYLMGLILLICIALPLSKIDKYVLYSYLVFDTYGMYSYIKYGWPEPKNEIIFGFCLVILFLVGRLIWKIR